jgi:hypothetical protein
MRSRRGLRARPELLCALRWKDVSKAPAPSSPDLFAAPCVTRGGCDSCGLDRASPENVFRSFSSRPRSTDASDRLLHSETVPTRAPVSVVVSQRSDRLLFLLLGRCLAAPSEDRSHFRSLATPCPPTRTSLFACRRARPETCALGTGKLGAARCRRDWGDSRFTARFSLRRSAGRSRGGVFFHRTRPCRSPLTLLSPPSPRGSNRFRRIGSVSKAAKIDSALAP